MKKLLFIATGGTIASGDSGSGLSPEASAEELLSGVKFPDAEIHAIQPFALDSTDLTPQHWMEVAALIRDRWQDFDGFVITHGTDTMAYGAAALSCLIQSACKPIILTGSQLPMSAPDTDARRNLSDALLCAERGRAGVWVCFCGRVIAGNAARKVHTRDFDAFRGFTGDDEHRVEDFLTDEAGEDGGTVFYNRLDPSAAVLKLTPLAQPAVETRDEKLFFALVRAAFNMRRKTLVNALGPVLASAMSKEEIVSLVEAAGLDARIRGERLSLADYAKLADLASEKLNKG